MKSTYHAVIMAGGIGSRFWPLSRNQKPKQFLDILNTGKTLIQMTYDRLLHCVPKENIWVVSHQDYLKLIEEQLPEIKPEQILLEPERKNTAPCLMYASACISQKNPDNIQFIASSDHLIVNESRFIEDVRSAFEFIETHPKHLLTFGIQATRPDTGYGYIHFDAENNFGNEIFPVRQFVEKPDHNTAMNYLENGQYVWNSGMFMWSGKNFNSEMKMNAPALSDLFNTKDVRTDIPMIYKQCESISIDYALMEKTNHAVVKSVHFGWSDLGTWGSLYQLKSLDENQNSIHGPGIITDETTNCLIENSTNQLMAIQGLEDFIVVNTTDVLLICQKSSEQKIRELVKKAGDFQ